MCKVFILLSRLGAPRELPVDPPTKAARPHNSPAMPIRNTNTRLCSSCRSCLWRGDERLERARHIAIVSPEQFGSFDL